MIARGRSRWSGTWKEGDGTIATQTPTLPSTPYSYASRFDGADGANPEELLAAAYAGCLNQAFANTFGWGNFVAEFIETTVEVEVELGYNVTVPGRIHITVQAKVPGIKQDQFDGFTTTAMRGCMISRFLKIEPTMTATLVD